MDLRPWAVLHRYRWRYEESYRAESNMHVKGDGRWFIEIARRSGLIYAYGGTTLSAYAKGKAKQQLGQFLQPSQHDDKAQVFRFDVTQLDEVAAIMRPKRLGGSATLTTAQRENLKRHAFKRGFSGQIRTQTPSHEVSAVQPLGSAFTVVSSC